MYDPLVTLGHYVLTGWGEEEIADRNGNTMGRGSSDARCSPAVPGHRFGRPRAVGACGVWRRGRCGRGLGLAVFLAERGQRSVAKGRGTFRSRLILPGLWWTMLCLGLFGVDRGAHIPASATAAASRDSTLAGIGSSIWFGDRPGRAVALARKSPGEPHDEQQPFTDRASRCLAFLGRKLAPNLGRRCSWRVLLSLLVVSTLWLQKVGREPRNRQLRWSKVPEVDEFRQKEFGKWNCAS